MRKKTPSSLDVGRTRQKQRTRRLLVETAVKLIAAGGQPTVTEVADAADVSRRTAYRYFPTREKLHAEAALDGLRPVMEAAIASIPGTSDDDSDIEARVTALVANMQRLAIENESLLRTMIHQTVLQPSPGEPARGSRRLEWIELAVASLRPKLGAAAYSRLVCALALSTGIEALLVLRDLCGLTPEAAVKVSQWMARVFVKQSLAEHASERRRRQPRQV
jgi:AcrR family transcriptional regulator